VAQKPYNYALAAVAIMLAWSAPARAQAASPAAHTHIGHVMTSWKDTPDQKGFLPTAIADAQVALEQVERADLEGRINDFVLYGGYVLHALDAGAETQALLKKAYERLPTTYVKIEIPGTGYGIKRAVAGALQHVRLAAESEGASDGVKQHTEHVTASLENVTKWSEEAIATARKLIAASDVGGGQILVDELTEQITRIAIGHDANGDGQTGWQSGEGGLRQANTHMRLMMKAEGLQ
jgi:hypothetical protein